MLLQFEKNIKSDLLTFLFYKVIFQIFIIQKKLGKNR